MENKKLSFIIVNFATKGLVEKNVKNLLEAWDNCEIIIVDSDSPDGSADLVEELFDSNPRVTLIRNKNNGLSAGNNLGLKKATGDYIVHLGTDAFPTKDALESLVKFMDENPDAGMCTPKLFTRDGAIDLDAHRSFPTPWVAITHFLYLDKLFPKSKLVGKYFAKYEDFNSVHEIDACISHFMFVRPEIYEKIGEWDEDFFLYGEDIDICYRVKEAGFKIFYLGNVKVLHYKGASVGRATSQDIENAMNTDFDKITFKGEVFKGSDESKYKKKRDTKTWMKMKVAKESTKAMKIFYKKHFVKKYPFFLNWMVFIGIWVNEKIRLLKIILK
jgi:GT2 family glycosyltransferase